MRSFHPRAPRRRRRPALLVAAIVIGMAIVAVWFCISPMAFLRWRFWQRWPPFGAEGRPANFEIADVVADRPPATNDALSVDADRSAN